MRSSVLVVALALVAGTSVSALAQGAPQQSQQSQQPDPEKQALAFEIQECVAGRLRSTTQAFVLQGQIEALRKRAETAEARVKELEGSSTAPAGGEPAK